MRGRGTAVGNRKSYYKNKISSDLSLDYRNESQVKAVASSPLMNCIIYLIARLIFFLVKVPAHHSAPASAALAEGSRADCI